MSFMTIPAFALSFFTDPEVTTANKILEVMFIIMGLIAIYNGIKNLLDEENDARIGTAVFWVALGIVMAFGRWIPALGNGIIIIIMTIPPILKQVKIGKTDTPAPEEEQSNFDKIGMKIFIPALTIGLSAIAFALFTKLGALVGIGFGVLLSVVILMIYSRKNTPDIFLKDSSRLLSVVGPLSMLPMLLASLGAIFTAAGVGDVIAELVGKVIPAGNVNLGIIVFAVGMALFTMIMGNAFAAITVMTVGIGHPFVLAYGANPVVIGMVALTAGYCGTLMTPMAANFNIVPVAMLDMKDRWGVIKNQVIPALILLVFQIAYMIILK